MTLNEKFDKATDGWIVADACEEIADDYAIAFAEWLAEHPRPSATYFYTYEGEAEVIENVPESDALSEWELTDIDDFESMGEEDW